VPDVPQCSLFWGKKDTPYPRAYRLGKQKTRTQGGAPKLQEKKVVGLFLKKRTYLKVLKNRENLVHGTTPDA
jgi:hypothetical protein